MSDEIRGLTFFDGVASGQQRSALQRLEPSHIMISYATKCNRPWDGDYTLFVDSGGFHHMIAGTGEYERSDDEYLEYIETHEPALWALRDYPCEPELLDTYGRSVADHQQMTTERHRTLLEAADRRDTPGQPVTVLQGYTVNQYLEHYDALREQGILTNYVGVGTLCGREDIHEIASVLQAVRDELGTGPGLHGFGLDKRALTVEEVVEPLTSTDSAAYDFGYARKSDGRDEGESFTWRDCAREYLNWRHDLSRRIGSQSLYGTTMQTSLEASQPVADGGFTKAAEGGGESE